MITAVSKFRTGFGPQATAVGVSTRAVAATALVETLEKANPNHAEALQRPRPYRREQHLRGVLT